jgi:hypothetical protein
MSFHPFRILSARSLVVSAQAAARATNNAKNSSRGLWAVRLLLRDMGPPSAGSKVHHTNPEPFFNSSRPANKTAIFIFLLLLSDNVL